MLMTRGLRMRRIRQRLAKQAFGRRGIAHPREHEVDHGAAGIDGSVEGTPATFDTNVGLIDTPGPIGWLEMTAQPLLQFRPVALWTQRQIVVWCASRPRSLSTVVTERLGYSFVVRDNEQTAATVLSEGRYSASASYGSLFPSLISPTLRSLLGRRAAAP